MRLASAVFWKTQCHLERHTVRGASLGGRRPSARRLAKCSWFGIGCVSLTLVRDRDRSEPLAG